ncbi:MAG: hypothetical protein AAB483_01800 [Patescibacteria group bacterium]
MKNIMKFMLLLFVVAGVSFGASLGFSQWRDARVTDNLDANVLRRFEGREPQPTEKGSIKLTTEEASFFHVIPNKQEIRYYHARTGQIKSLSSARTAKPALLATIKPRASDLTWSPDGTEIIASYGTERIYVNVTASTQTKLDANILNPKFGPVSDSVAYLYFDKKTEAGVISIADSQFKTFKNLLKTRLSTWEIQWADERKLSLLAAPPSSRLQSLYLLTIDQEGLDILIDSKTDIETNWSPDGQHLLYSRKTQNGIELFLLDLATRAEKPLEISSMASKCGWTSDSSTLYCGVPEKDSDDAILKISMTGTQEKIFAPADAGFVDARNIVYIPIQNALLFKNFKDGRLYLLSLAK